MTKNSDLKKTAAIFALIFLEGYIVLSSELLAIRQLIPFVGAGTDTTAIIISAFLLPLALGYYYGGNYKKRYAKRYKSGQSETLRNTLLLNIIVASAILLFGLSYAVIDFYFTAMASFGFMDRLFMTTIYVTVFMAYPVFLLGQTIPLSSNYLKHKDNSKLTGLVLFFSTTGSFLGATISTLIFMSFFGVNIAVIINFVLLIILVTLLSKRILSKPVAISFIILFFASFFNSGFWMKQYDIVSNNQYNTVSVSKAVNGFNMLRVNDNLSAFYNPQTGQKADYVDYIEQIALRPLSSKPKNILVLGAGGFTFGVNNRVHNFDYVDIDPALKDIAEKEILERKLGKNAQFHALPARAFLNQSSINYDLIFIDIYTGDFSVPEHLLTSEFFEAVKSKLNEDGVMAVNFLASPNLADEYSVRVDNTFRTVFKNINRIPFPNSFDMWAKPHLQNIIYLYKHTQNAQTDNNIYTDNKNTSFMDKMNNGVPHNQK